MRQDPFEGYMNEWWFWGLDDRFYGPFNTEDEAITRKVEVDDKIS